MTTILTKTGSLSAEAAMHVSRDALDRALLADAELTVAEIMTASTVMGAFQRHHGLPSAGPRARRVSGGPFVNVGPGTLHVVLALTHPAALVACDARHIVNRYVRPLLRALTKGGALAHYFGREWISVAHRPVGQVGFAHDSRTKRTVFEAFVAVRHPFASRARASFLGKEPGTLESVTGRAMDLSAIRERIVQAYAAQAGQVSAADIEVFESAAIEPWDDPPWAAMAQEAIGDVAAGLDHAGVLRLGGDLLASRDALDRVASLVATLPTNARIDAIGAIVDGEFTGPDIALDGVRELTSLRDVLARAHLLGEAPERAHV